jgi:2-methylaconitate cis-trans-isomerase PrpF
MDLERIVIEHPSGRMEARCPIEARTQTGMPVVSKASVITSARPLFTGSAMVRERAYVNG